MQSKWGVLCQLVSGERWAFSLSACWELEEFPGGEFLCSWPWAKGVRLTQSLGLYLLPSLPHLLVYPTPQLPDRNIGGNSESPRELSGKGTSESLAMRTQTRTLL